MQPSHGEIESMLIFHTPSAALAYMYIFINQCLLIKFIDWLYYAIFSSPITGEVNVIDDVFPVPTLFTAATVISSVSPRLLTA